MKVTQRQRSNPAENPRFWSANAHGLHPSLAAAFTRAHKTANVYGSAPYAQDTYTKALAHAVSELFGPTAQAHLVPSGTSANALALSTFVDSTSTIVTPACSHIAHFEVGAIEYATQGARIDLIPDYMGKIDARSIDWKLRARSSLLPEQLPQPKVLVVSQLTELGTCYSVAEMQELSEIAHTRDMKLVVDGARLFQAAQASNVDLRRFVTDTGVDALSLDLSKCGGDGCLVIFFSDESMSLQLRRRMKQCGLVRPSGFGAAAAAVELLGSSMWKQLALQVNSHASALAHGLARIGISTAYPVQGNLVFVRLPQVVRSHLETSHRFYTWDRVKGLVRFEIGHATTHEWIKSLLDDIEACLPLLEVFAYDVKTFSEMPLRKLRMLHNDGKISDEMFFAAAQRSVSNLTVGQLHQLLESGVLTPAEVSELCISVAGIEDEFAQCHRKLRACANGDL